MREGYLVKAGVAATGTAIPPDMTNHQRTTTSNRQKLRLTRSAATAMTLSRTTRTTLPRLLNTFGSRASRPLQLRLISRITDRSGLIRRTSTQALEN
jgi:hypothetical protein